MRDILHDCGAVAAVEAMIDQRVTEARTALDQAGFAEPAASVLADLVGAATARTA